MELPKNYSPEDFESRIYDFWMKNNFFEAKVDKNKEPFTMVMPPPNITGTLHMGHALNNTIQDVIARFKRMQGFSTLWLPGTDHASIATEVKIVEKMRQDGVSKQDIGREGFLERAWDWKREYGGTIVKQLKRLGGSCDWSREAFTMDEKCSKAVRHVFVSLYKKGLIFKGQRIINVCPVCKTALSDAEVEYEEKGSFLWHIKYPFEDGSGYVTVATTRPETMLGDTAVAVNPDDERYAGLTGKMLILPLTGRKIQLIADSYVDKEFGTGAVKITPAHDPNDFEVGQRNGLEVMLVMNEDGTMNANAGRYAGMTREAAREAVVADLEAGGLLEKTEPHNHNAGHCYRCKTLVEPIASVQWFVKMKTLAKPAVRVVKNRKVEFIPERFSKVYLHWMENIKDWCISRQLWWGHRIPAFYCRDCGNTIVETEDPSVCTKCGSDRLVQDEYVLDTWFSSALWPFSTLGFPDETKDLKYFYPNNLLVTAYDIIFFWVARMIFSGLEFMGDIPFSDVLINGLVRDDKGRKMSKSLGNGIDPLVIIDKFGADSLRFMLSMGVASSNDMRYSESKNESCRNFVNKLWNAARFVLGNISKKDTAKYKPKEMGTFRFSPADRWILSRLQDTVCEVTVSLSKYELGLASSRLYEFVRNEYCDWYIELSKTALYGDSEEKKENTVAVLLYVLDKMLKLLHPFIPFVTEEIYQQTPKHAKTIMLEEWPEREKKYRFKTEADEFENVMDIIKTVRNFKSEMNVPPSKQVTLYVIAKNRAFVEKCAPYIKRLAGISEIVFAESAAAAGKNAVSAALSAGEIFVPLGELIDIEKETARLKGEYGNLLKEIERAEKMLANKGFTDKAPAALVEKEKKKLEDYRLKADAVAARIRSLS